MDISGRTVLLTGATGGIGSALVDELLQRGARVAAVGRDPERLRQLVARSADGSVVPILADVVSAADRRQLVAQVSTLAPTPSLLILAHAQSAFGMFEHQSEAELSRLVETNLLAPMLLIRALLPMLQTHPQAAVVAVGSTFGSVAFPGFCAYSATKFGLRGLMEGLAREHPDGGVSYRYLSPRATRTAFNSPAVDALNSELKVAIDEPSVVAKALIDAIVRGDRRRQLGWPEKFFARLNGAMPGLVDRALKSQLPAIRRHAGPPNPDLASLASLESTHDHLPS